jgi:hypothetical protein
MAKLGDFAVDDRSHRFSEREGLIVSVRQMSIEFFDDVTEEVVFVPRSLVDDWWFTDSKDRNDLSLDDLEDGDEVILCIAKWFVQKELGG